MDHETYNKMTIAFHNACAEWADQTENGYHVDFTVFKKGFECGLRIGNEIRDSKVSTVLGLTVNQIRIIKDYYLEKNNEVPE